MMGFIRSCLALALLAGTSLAAPTVDVAPRHPAAAGTRVLAAPRQAQAFDRLSSVLDLRAGDGARITQALAGAVDVFASAPRRMELTGEMIVRPLPGRAVHAGQRVAGIQLRRSRMVDEYVVRVPAGVDEGELAAALMATGDYEFVSPNWRVYPAFTFPNDPLFPNSWQHTRLRSAEAWDFTTGSSDIIVAVCDSGIDIDHPDLAGALVSGYNSATRRAEVNGGLVDDVNGHGTFVAGCAAAIGNNSRGVVGVGWNFSLMPIRVTNNSDGTAGMDALIEGARWAAENGAQIVNVSFTGVTDPATQSAGRDVRMSGGQLFWAAGNAGSRITANWSHTISVAATNSADNRWGSSNFGPGVDIGAPGSGVRSTRRGGGYGASSGTSYASPIAAGVGALVWSMNPDFQGEDVERILLDTAEDVAPNIGAGRVSSFFAAQLAPSVTPSVSVPVFESFETVPPAFAWSGVGIEFVADPAAPAGGAAVLLDENDTLTSGSLTANRVSFPTVPAVISFNVRTEGVEAGKSLSVEYLDEADVWQSAVEVVSTGAAIAYQEIAFPLQGDAVRHGLRLRFRADGDASDDWYVDRVTVGAPPADRELTFTDDFESGSIAITKWSDDTVAGASVALADGSRRLLLEDSISAETLPLRVADFFIATGVLPTISFATSDGLAQPGDQLRVEISNVAGEFETLATVSHGQGVQVYEEPMSLSVLGANDAQLRFTSLSGTWLVDDVIVGVAPVTDCPPDLNGDDELNFFDVSAFLTAFNDQDPIADFNGDDQFDFFDVSAFLSQFNAGCE